MALGIFPSSCTSTLKNEFKYVQIYDAEDVSELFYFNFEKMSYF